MTVWTRQWFQCQAKLRIKSADGDEVWRDSLDVDDQADPARAATSAHAMPNKDQLAIVGAHFVGLTHETHFNGTLLTRRISCRVRE